jgi:hypothetical protein
MRTPRTPYLRLDWLIIGGATLAGVAVSLWLWQSARTIEEARNEMAFSRQVEAHHALIHQTLDGY